MACFGGLFRYCMRHPTRMLFISLLLVLVIASRFLFSSVPEEGHVHELNLMTGTLSQQLGRGTNKHLNRPGRVDQNSPERTKASKKREKDLSSETSEDHENLKSSANEIKVRILKVDAGERNENDLHRRRHKIPDRDRDIESEGNLSPFEEGIKNHEVGDSRTARRKIQHHNEPNTAKQNISVKRKQKGVQHLKEGSPPQEYNVLMTLAKVGQTSLLAQRFKHCLQSICVHSSVNLSFHILTDEVGKLICHDAFSQMGKVCNIRMNVTYYDVKKVAERVRPIVREIQHFFKSGDPNSYYNDPLFFVSTAIHHVLPRKMARVIFLDSDLLFQSDINELFAEFDNFKPSTLFGLAKEQQPTYRHVLYMFRDKNPGTKVGGPPPDGLSGFNSGVLLINLRSMRNSELYKKLLQGSEVKRLANKYTFQGNLGDQDFYSLLSLEYSELFHVLPCSWNRQLCTYWQDKYPDVFDSYFNCTGLIHVYHGNCATKLPNES